MAVVSRRGFFAIFLAYAIFWLLAMVIENHGVASAFGRREMTPLDLVLFVPFVWGYALFAIQTGSMPLKFSTTHRDEKPGAFWGGVAFCIAYGIVLIVMAIHRMHR